MMIAELINPETLAEMSQEDIEAHLAALRKRRETAMRVLRRATDRRNNLPSRAKLHADLDRKIIMLTKRLKSVDDALDKAQKVVSEIVALRLEAGDDISSIG